MYCSDKVIFFQIIKQALEIEWVIDSGKITRGLRGAEPLCKCFSPSPYVKSFEYRKSMDYIDKSSHSIRPMADRIEIVLQNSCGN